MARFSSLLFLMLLLVLIAAAPSNQPSSPLTARAHRMLESMKETSYQHTTKIDEAAGEYHCDCSGLVGYLLRKDLPEHFRAIRFPEKSKRPRAVHFTDHFLSAPTMAEKDTLWLRVERLVDARAGDLIAWKKDPQPETGSTGHVVLVDGSPLRVAENLYSVVIIDSTTSPHLEDTRKPGTGGVGRGTLFIRTDDAGRPVSRSHKSEKGPFVKFPMAIGRPVVAP